jgi:hypothetical protein
VNVASARGRLQLAIGAVNTVITSRDPELTLTVPAAGRKFVVEGAAPDIHIHAQWSASPLPVRGRLLFDSGSHWRLHADGDRLAWSFTSPKFGPIPYKTAVFDRNFSAGEVYLHKPYFDPSLPMYPLEFPLDELLITNWLALGRGIEIHGCGVHDADGSGYLFAGHSGAGKTTISRLWDALPGVTVLSDDRIILRQSGNQIFMHGTPWHGDEPLASPCCVPLTRGFILHHGHRNETTRLTGASVAANLFSRSFPPFFSAEAVGFSLSFLNDVGTHVPFSDLGFVPDRHLPNFVRTSRG